MTGGLATPQTGGPMVVGWTGHRPDVFRDPELARQEVERAAESLVGHWPELEFVSGGQRGVDLWVAAAAIAWSVTLRIVLPIPAPQFAQDWAPGDRRSLEDVLGRAESVEVMDREGGEGSLAYDRRNETIVRRSGLIVAVWTGVRRGGTFYTLCAARARGLAVEDHRLEPAPAIRTRGRGL